MACSAGPKDLCNYDRRYHEEQFCEVIITWLQVSLEIHVRNHNEKQLDPRVQLLPEGDSYGPL